MNLFFLFTKNIDHISFFFTTSIFLKKKLEFVIQFHPNLQFLYL